ncbi:MAG TPA: 5'/3'-nucleotidase SurE [bacterium]|nr:5'/3'-nucleotidase SurE [bacterium]
MDRPRILVSNDDGLHSKGLLSLARELDPLGDMLVCAPMYERSGAGHSITIHKPIRVERVSISPEIQAWAADGSPADCVKYAVSNLYENEKPDLVVSGVNLGLNLSTHIFYSGTLGAALEATMLGIPSVAVSLGHFGAPLDPPSVENSLEHAARLAARLTLLVLERGIPPHSCLNVNIPNIPPAELRGIRITRHGRFIFQTRYQLDEETGGWLLRGPMSDTDDDNPELDHRAVRDGFVSITPLDLDLNDAVLFDRMRGWELDGLREG